MSLILGLNAFHGDASACVMADGRLLAATEEERFTRIKHWAGFPGQSVQYCLQEAGASLDDVDVVAINSNPRSNAWRKLTYAMAKRPPLATIVDRIRNARSRRSLTDHFARVGLHGGRSLNVLRVDHHLAHLASGFLVSGQDQAVVVSVDGFGDFASAAWGIGTGDSVRVDRQVTFPHSLGVFYQAMTQYLGFPNYGDEYKVMGLASYGEPRFCDQLSELVRLLPDGSFRLNLDYFRHHRESIAYRWEEGSPAVGDLFGARLEQLLGPRREADGQLESHHMDIAASIQTVYQNALFHLLNRLHERYAHRDLILTGGCAMNSVANGRIYQHTEFENVYLPPACGDAGGAIGAAAIASVDRGVRPGRHNAYLGPSYRPEQVESVIDASRGRLADCLIKRCDCPQVLADSTAEAIAAGEVVGWFQGRMEWGPRALGNRSILCDPRRGDMKALLNQKIKRRESFRPFAPSILRESVSQWFVVDDDVAFMSKVFPIRAEQRARIPAVTHIDGTGRLHTVSESDNALYHRLIRSFQKLTGVPMLLNTSFNENEPIVCTPAQALDCFLRTDMDRLVLGTWCIVRRRPVHAG